MRHFVDKLHQNRQCYSIPTLISLSLVGNVVRLSVVVTVDPGISKDNDCQSYNDRKKLDVFSKVTAFISNLKIASTRETIIISITRILMLMRSIDNVYITFGMCVCYRINLTAHSLVRCGWKRQSILTSSTLLLAFTGRNRYNSIMYTHCLLCLLINHCLNGDRFTKTSANFLQSSRHIISFAIIILKYNDMMRCSHEFCSLYRLNGSSVSYLLMGSGLT